MPGFKLNAKPCAWRRTATSQSKPDSAGRWRPYKRIPQWRKRRTTSWSATSPTSRTGVWATAFASRENRSRCATGNADDAKPNAAATCRSGRSDAGCSSANINTYGCSRLQRVVPSHIAQGEESHFERRNTGQTSLNKGGTRNRRIARGRHYRRGWLGRKCGALAPSTWSTRPWSTCTTRPPGRRLRQVDLNADFVLQVDRVLQHGEHVPLTLRMTEMFQPTPGDLAEDRFLFGGQRSDDFDHDLVGDVHLWRPAKPDWLDQLRPAEATVHLGLDGEHPMTHFPDEDERIWPDLGGPVIWIYVMV